MFQTMMAPVHLKRKY